MKILITYLSRYKGLVFLSFLLATFNIGFSLCDPIVYGWLIDKVKVVIDVKPRNMEEHAFMFLVSKYILGLIGVAMLSRIAKAFQDYTVNTVIQKFGADVYTDGLKQALQLPYQRFEDQRSGETLAVLEKVRTDSEKFMTSFVNIVFSSAVSIIFVVVAASIIFPPIILVYTIGAILLSLLMGVLSKKIKLIQRSILRQTTALAGATTESLRNIELIRSLGLTAQEIKRLNLSTFKILQLELTKVKSVRALSFIQGTAVNFLRQCIVFTLFYILFHEHITLGQVFTFQFFSFFIFAPLQELGNVMMAYREAESSLINFEKLMNEPIEPKPANPIVINEIEELCFDKVSYKHLTARQNALSAISFNVKKGETIAFVGPSGSGKTTLVKLLVGLYHPLEGNIVYNNVSYQDLDIEQFRHQIGFVTQDTQLFAGSIRENLLFVNPRATDDEMSEALKKASAYTLLSRAENGLDTMIGEGGMKISGGEKQRLSIARALLRHPKLLVFDEATSALDSITEEAITNTVKQISAEREQINILIAHRLSTIMHADRIYVLEKGSIVETGTHQKLVDEKGLYYAMWRQQIGERQLELID
ncbi:MAG: ABC transporter ATP-binding protein/permease [Chitinophagaceae bacterium]|jgi:ATP-binding cassette subfamily B protein|nr:ABC transporter ATP-binding protein/permease [Chitinophagaceae bacterium]